MVNMYTNNAPMLYIYTFFIMLEIIDDVMHWYVVSSIVALDILRLTSKLPDFCLIDTMVGSFHLYES